MIDPLNDGISELTLLNKMGSDIEIVNAARVSYVGESKGYAKDKRLLHYLYRHQHWTPFRQQVMKFKVKCPLFVARQWRTHQWADYEDVQWVFNEQSGRYVEMPEEFYISEMREQAKENKQGSVVTENCQTSLEWEHAQNTIIKHAKTRRNDALYFGVAKELANRLLPQTVYTSFIWTVNLHSLINFLNLRTDPHAQWEIRRYAEEIAKILEQEFPWVYECWKRYKMIVIDTENEMVVNNDGKTGESNAEYYKGTDYVSTD